MKDGNVINLRELSLVPFLKAPNYKLTYKYMKNAIMFSGQDPLSIRATGTGEYIKNELTHLVDLFDLALFEAEESIRQDYENHE